MNEEYEDCACCHGVDCFDYMGTCVYCGFQLSEEQMKERNDKNNGDGSPYQYDGLVGDPNLDGELFSRHSINGGLMVMNVWI